MAQLLLYNSTHVFELWPKLSLRAEGLHGQIIVGSMDMKHDETWCSTNPTKTGWWLNHPVEKYDRQIGS